MKFPVCFKLTGLISLATVFMVQTRSIDSEEDEFCTTNDILFYDAAAAKITETENITHTKLMEDQHELNMDADDEYINNEDFPSGVLRMDTTGRFDLLNPEIGPEGEVFLEGDMVMDDLQEDDEEHLLLEDLQRKFVTVSKYLWPVDPISGLPTVPFTISPSVEQNREAILDAIEMWENVTCLNFTEMEVGLNESHISFAKRFGCWSFVGRQYKKNGPQILSVGRGCKKPGIIAHEIGHALGMLHEQSRSDRDDHVVVMWDNIKPRKRKNFKRRTSANADVPYDSSSIMHYGGSFFSKEGNLTLVTRNPYHQRYLGQRESLSFRDVLLANTIYGCLERWSVVCKNTSMQCTNGGYFIENCACRCPPGTAGELCHIKTGEYYPELPCGGNITTALNISTPNFPNPFPSDSWCMWWAQAKKCEQVKLTFHAFYLMHRTQETCYWDSLELRDEDPVMPGEEYCGCDIKKGQEFTSKNGSLFLSFNGRQEFAKGFSASIVFVKDPSCNMSTEAAEQLSWKDSDTIANEI